MLLIVWEAESPDLPARDVLSAAIDQAQAGSVKS
jgi:hypothetical protein